MVTSTREPKNRDQGAQPRRAMIRAQRTTARAMVRLEGTRWCRPVSGKTLKARSIRATPATPGPKSTASQQAKASTEDQGGQGPEQAVGLHEGQAEFADTYQEH
jgi:hypothetical protein